MTGMLEIVPDRLAVHWGDFTEQMYLEGAATGCYTTGLVTESEEGVFSFSFMIHNWGFGVTLRWAPGPYDPPTGTT